MTESRGQGREEERSEFVYCVEVIESVGREEVLDIFGKEPLVGCQEVEDVRQRVLGL